MAIPVAMPVAAPSSTFSPSPLLAPSPSTPLPSPPSTFHPAPAPASSPACRASTRFSVGNPFPKSLKRRCERASVVVEDLLSHSQEQAIINDEMVRNAKGLVFISMIKGAYVWSGRIGSGVVIAKTSQNTWSAPSAISCLGVGYGAQAGLEFTDYVIILRDEQALNAFMQTGNLTIGANLALAVGPWGRNGEIDMAVTCGMTYSFSKSRGLFGGLSLEATVLLEGRKVNERCYGKGVTVRQILSGEVPVNQEVSLLHQALYQRFYAARQPSSTPSSAPFPSAFPSSFTPFPSASFPSPSPSAFSSPSPSPAGSGIPAPAFTSPYPQAPSGFLPSYHSGSNQERTDDKAGLLSAH